MNRKIAVLGLLAVTMWFLTLAGCGGSSSPGTTQPTPVNLPAPTGLHVVSSTPSSISLAWSYSSAQGDSFYVERSLGGEQNFAAVAHVSIADLSVTDTSLTEGGIYYYRVRAGSGSNRSPYSSVTHAAAELNHPPNMPSHPFPADQATNLPLSLTLTWQGGDPDGPAVVYDVYLGKTNVSPSVVSTGQAQASYNAVGLDANSTYYWQIVARDSGGLLAGGPIWQFHTGSGGASITVAFPNGGEQFHIGEPVTINWASSGIIGDVQIYLSFDSGINWPRLLVASTANSGQYTWTPPDSTFSTCRIRVSGVATPQVFGTSNADFSLINPWTAVNISPPEPLYAVQFVDASNGWIEGGSHVFHTGDGGQTWSPIAAISTSAGALYFSSASNGSMMTDSGVYRTTDGGVTWNSVLSASNLVGMSFPTPQTGFVTSSGANFYRTADSIVWNPVNGNGLVYFPTGCAFVTDQEGWVVANAYGDGWIYKTTDAGANWSPIHFYGSPLGVTFADADHGWICGRAGFVMQTPDGGNTWNPQNPGTNYDLASIAAADPNFAITVGQGGASALTHDGGTHWSVLSAGSSFDLHQVWARDRDHAWAVGNGGTVLRYNPPNPDYQ